MEKKLTIQCPCERQKTFKKTITTSKNERGINSFEIQCLFCEELLTIELSENLAFDAGQLRGLKKRD